MRRFTVLSQHAIAMLIMENDFADILTHALLLAEDGTGQVHLEIFLYDMIN